MIYLFIRHKVHHVPGAYTIYALVEWSLIIWDVGFDALSAIDYQGITVSLGNGKTYVFTLSLGDRSLNTRIVASQRKTTSSSIPVAPVLASLKEFVLSSPLFEVRIVDIIAETFLGALSSFSSKEGY